MSGRSSHSGERFEQQTPAMASSREGTRGGGHRKPRSVPTNRELTVSLIGAIVRFTLDIPSALLGPEEITSRQLLIWLRPLVEKLGKLIERIRHVCHQQTQHRIESGEPAAENQPPSPPAAPTGSASGPTSGRTHPPRLRLTSVPRSSVENNVSDVSAAGPRGPLGAMLSAGSTTGPTDHALSRKPPEDTPYRREVYIQRDGNYAVRETTERRAPNGTFQRVTKTISGPDVAILMSVTGQLSELPPLTVNFDSR